MSAPAPVLVNIAIIDSHYGKQCVHIAWGGDTSQEEAADLLQDQERPNPTRRAGSVV